MKQKKTQWHRHEESHDELTTVVSYTSPSWPGWRIREGRGVNRVRYYLNLEGTKSIHVLNGSTPSAAQNEAEQWLKGRSR